MSLAILHPLVHPFSAGVRGLTRIKRLALMVTATSSVRQLTVFRWCSDYRKIKNGIGSRDENVLSVPGIKKNQLLNTRSPASPDDFLLPSHYQQYQSDLLLAKINECVKVNEALALYEKHRDVMDTHHCLAVIRRLSDIVSSSQDQNIELLKEQYQFNNLASHLFVLCRRMEVGELLTLLKHLSLLGIPADAKLTQTTMQMVKDMINDLSLKQIIFLYIILNKMNLTPLSDALITAIPILTSSAINKSALAELSPSFLSQAFVICTLGKVKGAGAVLLEMYRRGSVNNVLSAMNIVWTLTEMSSPSLHKKLLTHDEQLTREVIMKECLEYLAREADSLTYQQIHSTISKISVGYSEGDGSCYNENFLHAAALHCAQNPPSFEKLAYTFRKLLKMNFLSTPLVESTVEVILSHPEEVSQAKVGLTPLISAITAVPQPTFDVKSALNIVMTNRSFDLDKEYHKQPLMVMAVDLLGAGILHQRLVDIFTSSDSLALMMSRYPQDSINHYRLLEIDQALHRVFHSPSRVPESFLEPGRKLAARLSPQKSSLKAILNQLVQDPGHLMSGVLTDDDIFIDHLLVLNDDGTPMKLSSGNAPIMKNTSVSSLDLPSEATKIAIMDIGSLSVFKPSNTLKGLHRLKQKVLEASGYKVVLVLQNSIIRHHEEERLLYLKRELISAGVTFTW